MLYHWAISDVEDVSAIVFEATISWPCMFSVPIVCGVRLLQWRECKYIVQTIVAKVYARKKVKVAWIQSAKKVEKAPKFYWTRNVNATKVSDFLYEPFLEKVYLVSYDRIFYLLLKFEPFQNMHLGTSKLPKECKISYMFSGSLQTSLDVWGPQWKTEIFAECSTASHATDACCYRKEAPRFGLLVNFSKKKNRDSAKWTVGGCRTARNAERANVQFG